MSVMIERETGLLSGGGGVRHDWTREEVEAAARFVLKPENSVTGTLVSDGTVD